MGLATLMALHYSKGLGPENRGVLSFVTVAMMLLSEILLNALNLELRSTFDLDHLRLRVRIFVVASLKRILVTVITLLIAEIIFSQYKSHIAVKLYIIFSVYIFIALFTQQLMELLLAFSRINVSSIIEVCIVFVQVLTYCLLLLFTSISLIVIVFLSLILSYSLASISIALYSRNDLYLLWAKDKNQSKSFLANANNFLPQTLAVSLLDRVDKILVLFMFSVTEFGKYMVAVSIFLTLRFVPEAIGKLILARRLKSLTAYINVKIKPSLFLLVLAVFPVAKIGDVLIRRLLGVDWSLPLSLYVVLLSAEVLRFFVIVELNRRNILKEHAFAPWAPLWILIAVTCSVLAVKPFLGIQSVPVVMFITYGTVFWILTVKLSRKPS